MKKILCLLLGAALLLPVTGLAQNASRDAIREDVRRAASNSHSYEFNPVSDTPAPRGYKPFYISHYGRHGSRSGWNMVYGELENRLLQAKDWGILKPEGDTLITICHYADSCFRGMNGRLTPKGVAEHKLIAERMYKRYSKVLGGDIRIRAIASMAQRCIISMASFTNTLSAHNPDIEWDFDSGEVYQQYIAVSGMQEEDYSVLDSLVRAVTAEGYATEDVNYSFEKLFTDTEKAATLFASKAQLSDYLYEVATYAEDFGYDETLYRYMSEDALYNRYVRSNVYLYVRQCNSAELGWRRLENCAKPLYLDVLNKAEEAIAGGPYAADLRFGHEYNAICLAAYLMIEGACEPWPAAEVCDHWCSGIQSCMATNVQMIFYRNRAGRVLVKFLYQEQESTISGLETDTWPYYDWESYKSYISSHRP